MLDPDRYSPEDLLGPLNEVERKNAPKDLFVRGEIGLLFGTPCVSVVGTRRPSTHGVARCQALVRALVGRGMVVVSGLAAGIDTIAHRAALELEGRTIAVLGTGLERAFPAENAALLEEIAAHHLVLSQFPKGTPPRRGNFPMRNRTMALVSGATVIIEAGESSGTQHQGWEALRLGRALLLLESLAARPDLDWPRQMIGYGAQVLTRENLDLVLDEVPLRSRGEPAF